MSELLWSVNSGSRKWCTPGAAWFPNNTDSLTSVSFSQSESMPLPAPSASMATPAASGRRASLAPAAFVVGGTATTLTRTPPPSRAHTAAATPAAPMPVLTARATNVPRMVTPSQQPKPFAAQDKENAHNRLEVLSPLRFPSGNNDMGEVLKPTMVAAPVQQHQAPLHQVAGLNTISASPLAVSLVDTTSLYADAPVPLAWSTPVRDGRKSLQAPTSADPRVEAIKERVATLLKSKKKAATTLQTPLMTPRPKPAAPATELEALIPFMAAMELTPYSAACEAALEESRWEDCLMGTPCDTPIHQRDVEMETVLEEEFPHEESIAVAAVSVVQAVSPAKPASPLVEKSFAAFSPNTMSKADRAASAAFSRDLIAQITSPVPVESVAPKFNFDKNLIESITSPKAQSTVAIEQPASPKIQIETLEAKMERANSWGIKSIFLIVLLLGAAIVATFFATSSNPVLPTPRTFVSPIQKTASVFEPIVVAPAVEIVEIAASVEVEIVTPIAIEAVEVITEVEPETSAVEIIEEIVSIEAPLEATPMVDASVEIVSVETPVEETIFIEDVSSLVEVEAVPEETIIPAEMDVAEKIEMASVEEVTIVAEEEIIEEVFVAPIEKVIVTEVETVVAPIESIVEEPFVEVAAVETDPSEMVTTWTWSPDAVIAEEDLFAMPFMATGFEQAPIQIIVHGATAPPAAGPPAVEFEQYMPITVGPVKAAVVIPAPVAVEEIVAVVETVVAPVEIIEMAEPIAEVQFAPIIEAVAEIIAPVVELEIVALVEAVAVVEAAPVVEVAVVEAVAVEAVAEPEVAAIAWDSMMAETEAAPVLLESSSSWGTSAIVASFLAVCFVGAYLQSLEGAAPVVAAGAESSRHGRTPLRSSMASPENTSPFSFTDASTPMVHSSRPSLSPIRPVRKIHFTPGSGDRPSSVASTPAFSNMEARLNRAEPALQAMASALAHGAAKIAKHVPANPSNASPLMRVAPIAPSADNRLHVAVPMIIPPRAAAVLAPVAEMAPPTTKPRARRATHQSAAPVEDTPVVETRRSTRLSRRV